MSETIQFYTPDQELVLIWCAVSLIACLLVLWTGILFGRAGMIVAATTVAAAAAGLWLSAGEAEFFYLVAFSLPVAFGALIGVILGFVRSRRLQPERL